MKEKYYLTFGQQSPFKDGWVEVLADDDVHAVAVVNEVIGKQWSNIYHEDLFTEKTREHLPQGKLGNTIKA